MPHAALISRLSLKGQVAVVTGGGGGIGRGIAIGLARADAAVLIGDIVAERAEEVASRIMQEGGQAVAVTMDAMESEQVRNLIAAADERFGRLDILVNNVGGTTSRLFNDQSERSWKRHIDLNFVSMLAATSAAVPIMIRGGRGGTIINVASIEASRAAPTFAVYAACKAATVNFTRTMALELGEHRIRINAIAPDHTVTPGVMGNRTGPVDRTTWRQRTDEEVDAMLRIIPIGREGIEEECGDLAVFLASNLSAYITGATIPIDGGTAASAGWLKGTNGKWTLNEGLDCTLG